MIISIYKFLQSDTIKKGQFSPKQCEIGSTLMTVSSRFQQLGVNGALIVIKVA